MSFVSRTMKVCVAAPIATADVASFLHEPPPTGAHRGYVGAPLTAVLIGEFLRMGLTVAAITVDYETPLGSEPITLTGPGFEFTIIPGRQRAWRFNGASLGRVVDLFRLERIAIARAVSASRADLVHAHWTYEFALGALDSGLPHVVTAHDSPRQVLRHTHSPYRALRSLMAREVFKRARCLTTVSPYMVEEIRALAQVPVTVIPNPVAARVLAAGRPRERPSGQAIAMVSNGWGRRKNPEAGLRAFAQFRSAVPSATLHLFGADFGPHQHAQCWAREQGIQGLSFFGQVSHQVLVDRLASLDALLHPALEESFGVVLAEAMALGLPVVAGSASGAAPWVLGREPPADHCALVSHDELGGVLVDVRSVDQIAAALQTVFGSSYHSFSETGHRLARSRFSPAAVAEQYVRQFEGIAVSSHPRQTSRHN
jgi:L-malate glycosyltransferase